MRNRWQLHMCSRSSRFKFWSLPIQLYGQSPNLAPSPNLLRRLAMNSYRRRKVAGAKDVRSGTIRKGTAKHKSRKGKASRNGKDTEKDSIEESGENNTVGSDSVEGSGSEGNEMDGDARSDNEERADGVEQDTELLDEADDGDNFRAPFTPPPAPPIAGPSSRRQEKGEKKRRLR